MSDRRLLCGEAAVDFDEAGHGSISKFGAGGIGIGGDLIAAFAPADVALARRAARIRVVRVAHARTAILKTPADAAVSAALPAIDPHLVRVFDGFGFWLHGLTRYLFGQTILAKRFAILVESDRRFMAAASVTGGIAAAVTGIALTGIPNVRVVAAVFGAVKAAFARAFQAGNYHGHPLPQLKIGVAGEGENRAQLPGFAQLTDQGSPRLGGGIARTVGSDRLDRGRVGMQTIRGLFDPDFDWLCHFPLHFGPAGMADQ